MAGGNGRPLRLGRAAWRSCASDIAAEWEATTGPWTAGHGTDPKCRYRDAAGRAQPNEERQTLDQVAAETASHTCLSLFL